MHKLYVHKLIAIEKRDRMHCRYHLLQIGSCSDETKRSHGRNSPVSEVNTNNTNQLEKNNNPIAFEIADLLNDRESVNTYMKYAELYPEEFLKRIIAEVKLTPLHKIKKSRKALFAYLIRYYANPRS
jgi:hypothetical protein